MQLVDEMRNKGFIDMASIHKYRPRTKHLNVKLHHFRQCVNDGYIKINDIETAGQKADYLTKPVDHSTVLKLRKRVMGWYERNVLIIKGSVYGNLALNDIHFLFVKI